MQEVIAKTLDTIANTLKFKNLPEEASRKL